VLKVGLTGGIGSGKSVAAQHFAELGVPIVDADIIARKMVEPGQGVLNEIVASFGQDVLDAHGNLDRLKLRSLVFTNPTLKTQLEDILHPRIHATILLRLEQLCTPYCIVVIPLLAESKHHYPLNRILVIDAPEALRLERTCQRDGQSANRIKRIMRSQTSREKRLALADDIIENSGTLEDLCSAIDTLHQTYLELAKPSLT